MKNSELITIYGGGSITGTLLSAITRCMNSIIEAGRLFGTSVRMMISGKRC